MGEIYEDIFFLDNSHGWAVSRGAEKFSTQVLEGKIRRSDRPV